MWRLNACERLIEPLPRTRKRFFAPDFVFIFGMMPFPFMRPAGPSQGSNYAPWGQRSGRIGHFAASVGANYLLPTAVLSCALAAGVEASLPCGLPSSGLFE